MAYKISGTELIKDDQTVTFNNITATQRAIVFNGIGASASFGYAVGGQTTTTIDKYSFSSDGNATDVGDLLAGLSSAATSASSTHGYAAGGGPTTDTIQKWSFAVDGNATDVGDLLGGMNYAAGQQSSTSGYSSGGSDASGTPSNVIQKFPFSSDANATDCLLYTSPSPRD